MSKLKRKWYELSPKGGYSLSDQLCVHPFKINEIKQQHTSVPLQHAALSEFLLFSLDMFDWNILAGALYYCGEEAALQATKKYLKREDGKFSTFTVLKVLCGV